MHPAKFGFQRGLLPEIDKTPPGLSISASTDLGPVGVNLLIGHESALSQCH